MRQLVLVGAGELARVVRSLLHDVPELEAVACAVSAEHFDRADGAGLPVVALEELAMAYPPEEHDVLVCVGYRRVNRAREELTASVHGGGHAVATLVHPAAWVSPDAEVGPGSIVFPRAVVEPHASVGEGTILWSGSVVAHNTRIGAFSFLAPNATVAGNASLGRRVFVGANATVRDGVALGDDCVVGAGALVKRDAAPGTVFPAAAHGGRRPPQLRLREALS